MKRARWALASGGKVAHLYDEGFESLISPGDWIDFTRCGRRNGAKYRLTLRPPGKAPRCQRCARLAK